jgi:hypothetical protein
MFIYNVKRTLSVTTLPKDKLGIKNYWRYILLALLNEQLFYWNDTG